MTSSYIPRRYFRYWILQLYGSREKSKLGLLPVTSNKPGQIAAVEFDFSTAGCITALNDEGIYI